MKIFKIVLWASSFAMLSSCGSNQNEDLVKDINKQGAIEADMKVVHSDSFDILITNYDVWNNGKNIKTISHTDTIPALGFGDIATEDAVTGKEMTVKGKKDYEIFITVK